jgi:periplasmic protein TonB
LSTLEARREPVLARREPVLRHRYPATAGTADDRLGPIAGARRETPAFGPLGSFGLHLAIVLILLFHPSLSGPPALKSQPIPVSLVILPPKPKPPPAPKPLPKPKPPPGSLASIEMGPTKGAQPSPAPTQPAAGAPPKLEAMALPLPPPPKLDAPAEDWLPFRPRSVRPKPTPRPAALEGRSAKYPGPSATKDEYLAYVAMLLRRHFGLLTPQFLAGRRGQTVLEVVVLDNGTVMRLSVLRSSGYPDVDRKVEDIVRAIGRWPPLPQYVQGPSGVFSYHFAFPESLRE